MIKVCQHYFIILIIICYNIVNLFKLAGKKLVQQKKSLLGSIVIADDINHIFQINPGIVDHIGLDFISFE